MKFDDVGGSLNISSEQSRKFFDFWFNDTDIITLVGRRSVKKGYMNTLSQSVVLSDLLGSLDDTALNNLIFDNDSSWNLYFGVCPVSKHSEPLSRGKEDDIAYIPGVYADIDMKPGGFDSQESIINYLKSLDVVPSAVVGSGSGGVHAYWKLEEGQEASKSLIEYWWSYLDISAGNVKIDKLIDTTRILRVPGSVYFPREGSNGKIGSVELLFLSGRKYTVEYLMDISKDAYEKKQKKRDQTLYREKRLELDANKELESIADGAIEGNSWKRIKATALMEDYVNNDISWEDILVPEGWTFLRTLRDDSREFARPGRNERSAVVDYNGSPVMSLLSRSEETGLFDLLDANIALTKYRVLLRLKYNDDINAMVEDLLQQIINKKG